ncbi:unnamed protein product [Plutella xylostella]|uniref:(diamondback moth) hypothetical protein n=1 Tax=Plutella xylostella TaxID=51655 RepID=A0A8S4FGN1_PLUXY|nr:unnamed protein product [Plutella xylostella]
MQIRKTPQPPKATTSSHSGPRPSQFQGNWTGPPRYPYPPSRGGRGDSGGRHPVRAARRRRPRPAGRRRRRAGRVSQLVPDAATTLVDYISFTKELRSTSSDHLLITVKRPHRNATAQSISRWIKQVLQESGVDAAVFSAHSARHAATSAAHSAGLSLDLIRKTAGWTASSSTFAKYYKRPLLQQSNFAKAVCIPNNSSS